MSDNEKGQEEMVEAKNHALLKSKRKNKRKKEKKNTIRRYYLIENNLQAKNAKLQSVHARVHHAYQVTR